MPRYHGRVIRWRHANLDNAERVCIGRGMEGCPKGTIRWRDPGVRERRAFPETLRSPPARRKRPAPADERRALPKLRTSVRGRVARVRAGAGEHRQQRHHHEGEHDHDQRRPHAMRTIAWSDLEAIVVVPVPVPVGREAQDSFSAAYPAAAPGVAYAELAPVSRVNPRRVHVPRVVTAFAGPAVRTPRPGGLGRHTR